MSYSQIPAGHDPSPDESLELQSLASSSESFQGSASSRGLSPLDSPLAIDSPVALQDYDSPSGRHQRSLSVSTIGDHMFNLVASGDHYLGSIVPLEKQKRLNLLHGLSLVVGLQIGSGIFASPNQVNSYTGSVGLSLLVWLFAGLLAWTGASSYAELGSCIPLNGGSQAYLNQIFGPLPSFLFSWTAITILKPGSAAIISIVFGEYFAKGLSASFMASYWMQKCIAILGLLLVTALNSFSSVSGAKAGNVFLAAKILLLLGISIIGLVKLHRFRDTAALSQELFDGPSKSLGEYAVALYAGLWAYDGWDNVNYVSAEMKNPQRDLPRVIHLAMPIVIIAYILTNVAYFSIMSEAEIEAATSVALTFATKIFGKVGGIIFALLISLSCIGALNATIFSSARLIYSAAGEGFLPQIFAQLHAKRGTPVNALLLQTAITTAFILVGEFHSLVTFYGVAGYSFYFLTVFGVIILRVKEPDLERPYKTFITTPVLFCCVALFLVSRSLFEKPKEAVFVACFIFSGLPIYFWRFGFHLPKVLLAVPESFNAILKKLKIGV